MSSHHQASQLISRAAPNSHLYMAVGSPQRSGEYDLYRQHSEASMGCSTFVKVVVHNVNWYQNIHFFEYAAGFAPKNTSKLNDLISLKFHLTLFLPGGGRGKSTPWGLPHTGHSVTHARSPSLVTFRKVYLRFACGSFSFSRYKEGI